MIRKIEKIDFFVLVFVGLVILTIYLQEDYVKNSEANYTKTVKKEIKGLINIKKDDALYSAKVFSLNKKLINIMKYNRYDELYKRNIFKNLYSNTIYLHIVDKNGVQRYLSWTKRTLGDNVLKVRKDLAKVIKNPKPISDISVGKFNITVKGISPIYSEKGEFLGILEVIEHLNTIADELKKDNIESVIVINNKFNRQIINRKLQKIGEYYISNRVDDRVLQYLKSDGIAHYTDIKNYRYIIDKQDLLSGYYVISIPLYDNIHPYPSGWYIAFVKDTKFLVAKETILFVGAFTMLLFFIYIARTAYEMRRKNISIIKKLDKEVERKTEENMKLLFQDSLTKAYKKSKFDKDVKNSTSRYAVMLDIKNFSKINEIYGFEGGDKVLKIVAKRVEKILKRKLYRINADEFVFFSDNYEFEIDSIKYNFFNDPIKIVKKDLVFRVFFSFAVSKKESNALRKLSISISEAKRYPYQKYIMYKEKEINKTFLKFSNIIYEALFIKKEREFVVYFQGIRNNINKSINKYEVLARLKVGDKIYTPFYFLENVKSSGFSINLTQEIVDKSFSYFSGMDEDVTFSVNITEEDLLTGELLKYFKQKADFYNIDPGRVIIEILEGVTSAEAKNSVVQLKMFKNLGFKIAIDDFGVEYSNFERIQELDVDFIKIDAKYIKNIDTDEKSYKIVQAITKFAHSMGIEVIAEYVENENIQNKVEEIGIDYSQGYLFSAPKDYT